MNISIVTLFPQLYQPFLASSIIGRAAQRGLVNVELINMFAACPPKKRIDSPTFGHGAGMILKPEIVEQAIEEADARHGKSFKIFFSPQGKKLDQELLKGLKEKAQQAGHLMLVAPRYEGVDARVEQYYADEVISIGDYVLMGGDLPAMVLLEGLLRHIPGVIGDERSVVQDSFTNHLVDYPEYTVPVEWKDMQVPDVVRSGDHKALAQWRHQQALDKTAYRHFAWLRSWDLSQSDAAEVLKVIPPHYVVLMHDQVRLKNGSVGTSSVTSLDIHDIARSCTTYGIKGYYIVTPLRDQQAIVTTLTAFWSSTEGKDYNLHRYQAMSHVQLKASLQEVIDDIARREGKDPLTIATAARTLAHPGLITYNDQDEVWRHRQPVLFMLGTSHGLADELVAKSNYLLAPVRGMTEFNHLSVRSAAAVIFDRWLGIQVTRRSRLAVTSN